MAQVDTISDNYYKPLERIDAVGTVLFWVISVVSIAVLFIERDAYPKVHQVVQVSLVVGALLFFLQGQIQRLYLFPRASDKRRQGLLSDSYGVTLTHERTVGYYNNDQTNPLKRLAASTMESAFFTHSLTRQMLIGQRIQTLGYLIIYLVAVFNRSTNFEILAVAAQAVFSEEIIARWLRMEWLRVRSEQVFDNLNRLFTAKQAFSRPDTQSIALDQFSFYETTKAISSVVLSSKLFREQNQILTDEWEIIRKRLGL